MRNAGFRLSLSCLPRSPAQPEPRTIGGQGEWRVRTGNYRIIDEIDDGVLAVLVLAVGHRRDVYRRR